MMIDDGKLNDYSTRQVARLLNVSTQSVLDLCQKGGFGYRLSVSGRWRIPANASSASSPSATQQRGHDREQEGERQAGARTDSSRGRAPDHPTATEKSCRRQRPAASDPPALGRDGGILARPE